MYYLKFSIVEKYFLTENQTGGFACPIYNTDRSIGSTVAVSNKQNMFT